jgi:hypothetical protein
LPNGLPLRCAPDARDLLGGDSDADFAKRIFEGRGHLAAILDGGAGHVEDD